MTGITRADTLGIVDGGSSSGYCSDSSKNFDARREHHSIISRWINYNVGRDNLEFMQRLRNQHDS